MSREAPIYLDNHATTPADPQVIEVVRHHLEVDFGNAASTDHVFGWTAERATKTARAQTAALIHARPEEIIFTSGATESNNLAIKGALEAFRPGKKHFITSAAEHKCVLESAKWLQERGIEVTILPVFFDGRINPDDVAKAITPDTALVSIMYANNEIGSINPIAEIGKICRERGVLLHVDAAQAVGHLDIDVERDHIDLMSASAHKFHGPKGVGFLYVRKNPSVKIAPRFSGGGQEMGLRSGTLNVPCIAGMGKAAELACEHQAENSLHVLGLRDRLYRLITEGIDGVRLNGPPLGPHRLPHNLNLSFEGKLSATDIIKALRTVALSSGSACTSASATPSHVLQAIGLSPHLVQASLRFGVSRMNTEAEIDTVAEKLARVIGRFRS